MDSVSAGEVDEDVLEACATFCEIEHVPVLVSREVEDLRERIFFCVGFELEGDAVFSAGGRDISDPGEGREGGFDLGFLGVFGERQLDGSDGAQVVDEVFWGV